MADAIDAKKPDSTFGSATIAAGDAFTATETQAVAVKASPGHPEHGKSSRRYYRDCVITGDVGLVFGRATAVPDRAMVTEFDRSGGPNGYLTTACPTLDRATLPPLWRN